MKNKYGVQMGECPKYDKASKEQTVQHRLVEAFNKVVGFWRLDLCPPVLDIIQGQIQYER